MALTFDQTERVTGATIAADPSNFLIPLVDLDAGSAGSKHALYSDLVDASGIFYGNPYNVRSYGALGNGIADDSDGFIDAIAAAVAANVRSVFVPNGTYLITRGHTLPTATQLVGESRGRSVLKFNPTANGTCTTVSAGSAVCNYNRIAHLSYYSTDLTYTKTAIDLVDVSQTKLEDVLIFGTGTGLAPFWSGGSGSIGVSIRGREAGSIDGLSVFADRPFYVSANPNTAAADNEDLDHWTLNNIYWVAGVGFHGFQIADGLGFSHLSFTGYQAWVGGISGIKINDTRGGTVIASRNLYVEGFRTEQFSSTSAYAIDVVATVNPIQQILLQNGLCSATAQGIKIDGFTHATLQNVTCARGSGDNLRAANGKTLRLNGFYAQPGSTFTPIGGRILIDNYDASLFAAPTHATYGLTRTGTAIDVEGVYAGVGLYPPNPSGVSPARQSVNTLFAGSGAPNNSSGANGDRYFRAENGAEYTRIAGKWQRLDAEQYSVKKYGAVGDGVTDDTAAINAAFATGKNITFPEGTYLANNLTSSTDNQQFTGIGRVIIKKNADGPLWTNTGRWNVANNIVLYGDAAAPVFTGDNWNWTGDSPTLNNCGAQWAYGRAGKFTGQRVVINGTNVVWQTADATATGFDLELGVAGTATLYHELNDIYTSQSTGGILLIDSGHHLKGGQFGKYHIKKTAVLAGPAGGTTSDARILGAITVELSNAIFTGNSLGASATLTFAAGTGNCIFDQSNVTSGAAITNNGNGDSNIIIRSVGTGSTGTVLRYGDDVQWVDVTLSRAAAGAGFLAVPQIQLPNNSNLYFKSSAGVTDAAITRAVTDYLSIANSLADKGILYTSAGTGAGSTHSFDIGATRRFVIDNNGAEVKNGRLLVPGGASFIKTSTALTNGAGVGAGTIANAPAAGNPTKWIGIDDNGTIRYIPAW